MNVLLLPTTSFLDQEGKFNINKALLQCGRIGGICYSPDGYEKLRREKVETTIKRVDLTINLGHHSIYDHVQISLEIEGIPKILAMILNNEKQYTTSEKSSRYTHIVANQDSPLSEIEVQLYEKWITIFEEMISEQYPEIDERKRKKLALENARYFVSVFVPTNMVYTVPLGQLNRIARWLDDYTKERNDPLAERLSPSIKNFLSSLNKLNLIEPRLQSNEKSRELSLFVPKWKTSSYKEIFGIVYATRYSGSFAQLAQAHRHRTIHYQMDIPTIFRAFVPPILKNYPQKQQMWIKDMQKVESLFPQGQMIEIYEEGSLEMFLLKCKERLCTHAQQEIMLQTSETLRRYLSSIEGENPNLYTYLLQYSKGARCTFPDYICMNPCGFKEGVNLTRNI